MRPFQITFRNLLLLCLLLAVSMPGGVGAEPGTGRGLKPRFTGGRLVDEVSSPPITVGKVSANPFGDIAIDEEVSPPQYSDIPANAVLPPDFAATQKAAEQGDASAQDFLGSLYEYGRGGIQDYKQAVYWYTKAAEQGYPKAQINLGFMFAHGKGVTLDYKQAAIWYTKAAIQGDANAQFLLGEMYFVTQEYKQAVYWYTKAAEQGHLSAQVKLGEMYDTGEGVAQDKQQAVDWYTKAVEQGYPAAICDLGARYYFGDGVPQDYQKALRWNTLAAEQEDAFAQYLLGYSYKQGQGVTQDLNKAVFWYTKAAKRGLSGAQFNLGVMYYNGQGVTQNYTQAATWYTKAAEQGDAKAQFVLGLMYAQGKGVVQNYGLSYIWSSLAAANNDKDAAHNRDLAAEKLTPQGLAEAQAMAARLQERINNPEDKSDISLQIKTPVVAPEPTFIGSGSGFIITPEGYILTCAHVVKQATAIKIKLGERLFDAKIIRQDPVFDLALIKVSAPKPLPALSFAKTRSAKLGQDVFTVGFPNPELQGVATKLTKGSISSLAGALDDSRIYQISVPVQPGNSGGPLLDYNGNVVGVVQAQIEDRAVLNSSGSLPQNINYAVKSAYALSLIDSLPEVAKKLPATDSSRSRTFAAAVSAAESSVVLVLVYE